MINMMKIVAVSEGKGGIVDADIANNDGEIMCVMRFSSKTNTISLMLPVDGVAKYRKFYDGEDLKVNEYVHNDTIKMITFAIYSIAVRQLQRFCERYNIIFCTEQTAKGSKLGDWVNICCNAYLAANRNRVE